MKRILEFAIAAAFIATPGLAAAQGNGTERARTTASQERAAQKHQHQSRRSEGIVGSSSASGTGSGTADDMRR